MSCHHSDELNWGWILNLYPTICSAGFLGPSSFSVESGLTIHQDPFAYFIRATYIPFDTMKSIAFNINPGRLGINQITVKDPISSKQSLVIHFPKPPAELRFFSVV